MNDLLIKNNNYEAIISIIIKLSVYFYTRKYRRKHSSRKAVGANWIKLSRQNFARQRNNFMRKFVRAAAKFLTGEEKIPC